MKNHLSDLIRETNADVYRGPYWKIAEYYFVRESIDSISGKGQTISVSYSKKYPNHPYSKITTDAWISLNLNGTTYAGRDIDVSHKGRIRSAGNNVYHISVSLNFDSTQVSFDVLPTTSPKYINLNVPQVSRSKNNVASDQPVRISLYSRLKVQDDADWFLEESHMKWSTNFELKTSLDLNARKYCLVFYNSEMISGSLSF